jgi:hypothetical protein
MNNITSKIIITDSEKKEILLEKNSVNEWDLPIYVSIDTNQNNIISEINKRFNIDIKNLEDNFNYTYYSSNKPSKITKTHLTTITNKNIINNKNHKWVPWHKALQMISIYDIKKTGKLDEQTANNIQAIYNARNIL